ncbi:MAG: phage holin family protein [Saprospiraceae bacterium]
MEIFNSESRTRVGELTAHIIEYLDTRWDLFLLQLTEKGLNVVTGIVTVMIMLLFGSIVLIFASIGAAICLGQWLDNPAAGYFIMAAVFFILYFLINMFARNYIRVAVSNSLLESIKDTDIDNEIPTQI